MSLHLNVKCAVLIGEGMMVRDGQTGEKKILKSRTSRYGQSAPGSGVNNRLRAVVYIIIARRVRK